MQTLAEAQTQLNRPSNPIEQAFANKALLQSLVLDFDHSNPNTVFKTEKPVDIGIFRVFPTLATMDWGSPSGALKIGAGQTYLYFHIPKSDDISNVTANEGYSRIADFICTRPDIVCLMGITYRVMAISAKRNQGFNTEEIPLPVEVMNYATTYWQNMMPDARPRQFQTAHAVWQDRNSFISRFSN